MPIRNGLIYHIALLFFITLLARPAATYATSWQATSNPANPTYDLSVNTAVAREGYFVLRLDQAPTTALIVEQSQDPEFTEVDAEFAWFGDFQQMTLSGFADGHYYFRIKADGHVLSNTVYLEVQHYPRWQAYSLFILGLLLFSCLVGCILVFSYRARRRS